ncbi:MAG: tetratricopeptide repeat protein [Candidatus Aminicenantes bacterium]|nr:tetratricopeptide repeat protein [Candidatus Aminicenantes bacterium]NIM78516.1 tetratricopeptide repeat protein [Candidatus Aminicenantes bacterium]NIN17752.1 tetratricopeptide repeat protein [Candidatus Aminicenantes bacterium]NIN41653.1 tetratricopeptide repeat protein [Candidatus Aminicenantes bacterium]NIN84402.1 tetratricopeptide repeat protein [Candidatus Aminicenantes bacterium]
MKNSKSKSSKTVLFIVLGVILLVILWKVVDMIRTPDFASLASQWHKGKQGEGKFSIIYPLDGTVFPPGITTPTFRWETTLVKEQQVNDWAIVVKTKSDDPLAGSKGFTVFSQGSPKWKPKPAVWDQMKRQSSDNDLQLTILAINPGRDKIFAGDVITIRTAKDKVGAPIFYRDVPLPFKYAYENLERIRWRLGDIKSHRASRVILENLPLCANCHSFTPDGAALAMDVDYANDKGSYMIAAVQKEIVMTPDKIITWSDYKREDGQGTFGLLSQISPDGRYVVSTVKDQSIFVPKDDLYYSQLFFPIKGILVIYDRQEKTYRALPGADDPQYVQSSPNWSPDGKYIWFAKAKMYYSEKAEKSKSAVMPTSVASEFIEGKRGFQYSLFRIPFNDGKGGSAEPIPGASDNGMSNYFPRFSPDGKWVVFTRAKNFMLLQPDSKLYIMPVEGGTPRLMNCNTPNMNSWHSWSPNGKWLVFASKWLGPYTQLYLTHIDEKGNDTPPVLLENLTIPNRAANIPEFVNLQDRPFEKLVDDFTDTGNYNLRIGVDKFFRNDMEGAIKAYNKALAQSPLNAGIYSKRGDARAKLKDFQKAVEDYDRALQLAPNYFQAYRGRAEAKAGLRDYKGAVEDYNIALRMNPKDSQLYVLRAISKAESGNLQGAIADLTESLRLKPNAKIYNRRADVKARLKDFNGALMDINEAIKLTPDDHVLYNNRGVLKADSGDLEGAVADYTECIKRNPDYALAYKNRGGDLFKMKKYSEARDDLTKAVELNPKDVVSYSMLGEVKFELRDFPGAIKAFDEAIRLNPNSADDYYKRGMVKLILRYREGGCADLRKAHELGSIKAMPQIRKYCGQ